MTTRAISQAPMRRRTPWWLVPLTLLFVGAGLAGTWTQFGRPLLQVRAARHWQATPCWIVPTLERDPAANGADSPRARFHYVVGGTEYQSSRFSFFDHLEEKKGRSRLDATARQATCYVNPADPADAVLDRGLTPAAAIGLIPLGIAVVGIFGFVVVRRSRRGAADADADDTEVPAPRRYRTPVVPIERQQASGGMVELRASQSPLAKLIAVTIFALFWNGILSFFFVGMLGDGGIGGMDICGLVFLTPFVLIGLGALAMVGYLALAMFNPQPILAVSATSVPLGESITLRWSFTGRFDRIERLRIGLIGREEATYTRGTRTTTDREIFFRRYAIDITRTVEIQRGEATIPVPADTMHTFDAARNKVIWHIVLHGEIGRWPDVKEEYPIQVLPLRQTIETRQEEAA